MYLFVYVYVTFVCYVYVTYIHTYICVLCMFLSLFQKKSIKCSGISILHKTVVTLKQETRVSFPPLGTDLEMPAVSGTLKYLNYCTLNIH